MPKGKWVSQILNYLLSCQRSLTTKKKNYEHWNPRPTIAFTYHLSCLFPGAATLACKPRYAYRLCRSGRTRFFRLASAGK